MIYCLTLWVCLFLIAPILAQNPATPPDVESAYPTITALDNASLPTRDRVDLARRLLNITPTTTQVQIPNTPQLGERKDFWVNNSSTNQTRQITAELIAMGEQIYIWGQIGHGISPLNAQALADAFDRNVYQQTRQLWGEELSPGIDGDTRIHALFTREMTPRALALFSSQHSYPSTIVPASNEHEMMFFNLNNTGPNVNRIEVISAAAHEFQHMIRYAVDANEYNWLDEGFSTFTQQYLGFDTETILASSFMNYPDTQLNDWDSPNRPISAHYGAALLFVSYFYDQYGLTALQRLSAEEADGWQGIAKTLEAIGGEESSIFFADWVIANSLANQSLTDKRYRYSDIITGPLPPISVVENVRAYPYLTARQLRPYATNYFRLRPASEVVVTVAMADTIPLLPTSAPDGHYFWYSNKGDNSDTTLTRLFDLSNVTTAQLHYKVWYDLEPLWDFGYVMVSADDGQTWQLLSTPNMTSENPNGTAYGTGYTGQSGGWLEQIIPLDEYVGQKILLRFEVITDDAITRSGMAVDEIAIPEIGFYTSAEEPDMAWQTKGWISTDNRLPLHAWVQIAQVIDGNIVLTRWLTPQNEPWRIRLDDKASTIILGISPFAPLTTVDIPYTLSISELGT